MDTKAFDGFVMSVYDFCIKNQFLMGLKAAKIDKIKQLRAKPPMENNNHEHISDWT